MVQLSDFKNGGNFYRRGVQKEEGPIAPTFGFVSAILWQKFKAQEIDKYLWLVKEINSLNFNTKLNEIEDHEDQATLSDASEELQTVCDAIKGVEEKNMQLKVDLERA